MITLKLLINNKVVGILAEFIRNLAMFESFKKLFKEHFYPKNCTLLKEKQLLLKMVVLLLILFFYWCYFYWTDDVIIFNFV